MPLLKFQPSYVEIARKLCIWVLITRWYFIELFVKSHCAAKFVDKFVDKDETIYRHFDFNGLSNFAQQFDPPLLPTHSKDTSQHIRILCAPQYWNFRLVMLFWVDCFSLLNINIYLRERHIPKISHTSHEEISHILWPWKLILIKTLWNFKGR